ncbi:MAG: hypothetical protein ACRD6X_13740 [Pyrinomonadaceae bacterium]
MQTDVAETIFGIVKVFPKSKQEKVLDFVTDLKNEEDLGLRNLLHEIENRGKAIPDEVWREIPSDGSVNHDHYLYGSKKRK